MVVPLMLPGRPAMTVALAKKSLGGAWAKAEVATRTSPKTDARRPKEFRIPNSEFRSRQAQKNFWKLRIITSPQDFLSDKIQNFGFHPQPNRRPTPRTNRTI